MNRRMDDAVNRWLAAEEAGFEEAAEAALLEAFADLPRSAPGAGFAARVVAGGFAPAAVHRSPFASRWLQAALAACLLATGSLAALLPGALAPFVKTLSPARAAEGAAAALVALTGWLRGALDLWQKLADIAQAIRLPFETPAVALAAIVCLLLSATAFALLSNLIARERNWSYVEPY